MSTRLHPETPIGEIAVAIPAAIPLFERLGLDYCCGGNRTLAEAAAAAGADAASLLAELAGLERHPDQRDWSEAALPELIDHIVATHHVYLKEAMPALWQMLAKVVQAHGENHPELARLRRLSGGMFQELDAHLMKEEQILFPMIRSLAGSSGVRQTSAFSPAGHACGSPEAPMRVMEMEHDQVGTVLRDMRALSGGYVVPDDACTTFRALYAGLAELEEDLHRHIHLENNVLHPRTRALLAPACNS